MEAEQTVGGDPSRKPTQSGRYSAPTNPEVPLKHHGAGKLEALTKHSSLET